MKKAPRRSKLEVNVDILRNLACHRPMRLTHLMYKANVNFGVLKQHIDSLIKEDLVTVQMLERKSKKKLIYSISGKGLTALKRYGEMENLLLTPRTNARNPLIFLRGADTGN